MWNRQLKYTGKLPLRNARTFLWVRFIFCAATSVIQHQISCGIREKTVEGSIDRILFVW